MLPHKPSAPKKSLKKRKACELPVEGTEMDVNIWKEYPEELMEVVVARLPVAAFLRFRSISHKWNSLLGSPRFLQLSEQVAQQNLPLLFASYSPSGKGSSRCSVDEKISGALYDPRIKKWHYNLNFPSASALFPACTAGDSSAILTICVLPFKWATLLPKLGRGCRGLLLLGLHCKGTILMLSGWLASIKIIQLGDTKSCG